VVTLAGTAPEPVRRRPRGSRPEFSLRWSDLPALARVACEGLPFRRLVRMVLPSVTIVTPAGEDLAALSRTVSSVSRQDYAGYQHVIVDRGESAGVRECALSADEAGRVIIVDANSADEFEALREGLEAATGEFVSYLPAGSVLVPAALKSLAGQLVARPGSKVIVFDEVVQRGRERAVARVFGRVDFRGLLAGEELRPESVVFRRSTFGRVHGLDSVAGRMGGGGLRHAVFLDLLLRLSKRARFVRGRGHFGVAWLWPEDPRSAQAAAEEREGARRHAAARVRVGQRARLDWWRVCAALGSGPRAAVEPAADDRRPRSDGGQAEECRPEECQPEEWWTGEPEARCPVTGEVPEWFVGTLREQGLWVYRCDSAGTMVMSATQRGESPPASASVAWCRGLEGVIVPAVSRVARRALGGAPGAAGRGIELTSPGLEGVGEGLSALGWTPLGRSAVGGASLVLTGDALTRTADLGPELARLFARAARGGVVVAFAPNAGCESARRGSWEGLAAGATGRRWLGSIGGWRLAAARAGLVVRAWCHAPAFGDGRGLIVVAIGAGAREAS
jgi:hypothetical protein